METAGMAVVSSAVVLMAGAWLMSDRWVAAAERSGWVAARPRPFVGHVLTGWGWAAAILAVIGAGGALAVAVWAARMGRGFAGGWTEAAVPVVPAAAARSAAAAAAGVVALPVVIIAGLDAPVGLVLAALAGYVAAECAPSAVRALEVRALLLAALDPILGWPTPGGWGRLHRVTMHEGRVLRVEARCGPNWTPGGVAAAADLADREPTAGLAGIIWGYDARRRLLIGVVEDRREGRV
ncbi:hypothetical protein [Mycobacterium sp. 1274756.6]|uniref:hypothetical protein n=1 Tax=Mycobacterium sp. 1274756.6 TaxID=1834076 RepID=UPI0012E84146|nr:hypothetical protein [Mycobacterium sp. 1274756.6]